MSKSVDLQRVSRFFFATELPFTVTYAGTENCQVHFRLTAAQERIVRAHFKIPSHLPIQFATCEIASQGYGRYLAFSLSGRPDESLKAILNIKAALWYAENADYVDRQRKAQRAERVAIQIVSKVRPRRRVVVKQVVGYDGRIHNVVCDRALQALTTPEPYALHRYRDEKIRREFYNTDLAFAVTDLRNHFGK